MEIERRALYNLMRMNWLNDPSIAAEPWQVEDYRTLPLERLFERLNAHDIRLNRLNFLAFASEVDTPEELTDFLLEGFDADVVTQDQVYLLLFELWRRLVTDRPSLSIFCDELDHQIYLYDHDGENSEGLQDAISNLLEILDSNSDQGGDPAEVFQTICADCANDLESFLYDYILDLISDGHDIYASELLEGFSSYVKDFKWFAFLRVQLMAITDPTGAQDLGERLMDEYANGQDPEFNLELLSFMVNGGRKDSLAKLVKKTIPLLHKEEEFQALLGICIDFYHRLDQEKEERQIQKILLKRAHLHFEGALNAKDPHYAELLAILAS